MKLEELLGCFNLTHQEAVLYLLLCSEGKLTGYEASKLSGISRSNTYTALASLVEKGAACIEEDKATRYIPVAIEEFCNNRIRKMQKYRGLLIQSIPCKREEEEGYITIKGDKNVLDKMANMISEAKERIYIAVSEQILDQLMPQIEEAISRKLRVVIITNPFFTLDGAEIYHSKTNREQIRLIADSKNVLTGDVSLGTESTCLFSKKKNLVDLFKESLRNEIELIKIKDRG